MENRCEDERCKSKLVAYFEKAKDNFCHKINIHGIYSCKCIIRQIGRLIEFNFFQFEIEIRIEKRFMHSRSLQFIEAVTDIWTTVTTQYWIDIWKIWNSAQAFSSIIAMNIVNVPILLLVWRLNWTLHRCGMNGPKRTENRMWANIFNGKFNLNNWRIEIYYAACIIKTDKVVCQHLYLPLAINIASSFGKLYLKNWKIYW